MPTTKNSIAVRGDIKIDVFDKRLRRVVRTVEVRNRIVQAGLNALPMLLSQRGTPDPEASELRIDSLRVGSGTTVAAPGDTGLVSEISALSVTLLPANFTIQGDALIVRASLDENMTAGTFDLREAGLFMPATSGYSNGRLFARQTHSPIQTGPGLMLNYSWTLTFTA